MLHPAPSTIIETASGSPDPATRDHLVRCPSCRRLLLEVEVLRALYIESAPEVPSTLTQKIKLRVIKGVLAGIQAGKYKGEASSSPLGKAALALLAALVLAAGFFFLRNYHPGPLLDPGLALLQSATENAEKPVTQGLPEVTPETELKPRQQASVDRAAKQLLIKHSHKKKNRNRRLTGLAQSLRKKFLAAEGAPLPPLATPTPQEGPQPASTPTAGPSGADLVVPPPPGQETK